MKSKKVEKTSSRKFASRRTAASASTRVLNMINTCVDECSNKNYYSKSKAKGKSKGKSMEESKGKSKGKSKGMISEKTYSPETKEKGGKRKLVTKRKDHGDHCCKGGVSAMKFSFEGDYKGLLTTNSQSSKCNERTNMKGKSGKKSSSQNSYESDIVPKFFPCDSECVFYGNCTEEDVSSSIKVNPGEEICLTNWDSFFKILTFKEKFPTDLNLYFIPNTTITDTTYYGILHTSCSTPIYPPYALVLGDRCNNSSDSSLVNLNEELVLNHPPYLKFIDGISPEYYVALSETNNIESINPITFSNCGCECNSYNPPVAPPTPNCELKCEEYIKHTCFQRGEGNTVEACILRII